MEHANSRDSEREREKNEEESVSGQRVNQRAGEWRASVWCGGREHYKRVVMRQRKERQQIGAHPLLRAYRPHRPLPRTAAEALTGLSVSLSTALRVGREVEPEAKRPRVSVNADGEAHVSGPALRSPARCEVPTRGQQRAERSAASLRTAERGVNEPAGLGVRTGVEVR